MTEHLESPVELPSITALQNLRRRLLDLTGRNRLINFRSTKKSSLRIIDELPNQLAKMLLDEIEMRFLPIPEPTEKELIQTGYLSYNAQTKQIQRLSQEPTASEWASHLGFKTSYELPQLRRDYIDNKHKDKAIQTLLYPNELENRLKGLHQLAGSAIQEMGANILYLAFGFLEWFEPDDKNNPHIAPLFLMPVRLEKGNLNRQTSTYEYTIKYSGEDIFTNLSMREKLRVDFSIALPEINGDTLPEDYFLAVQELINKNEPTWSIRRYITLSLFNFSKLLMYLDLDPLRWPKHSPITEHHLVSRFLDYQAGNHGLDDEQVQFIDEYPIDQIDKIHTTYPLVCDADSSQHSALIDALNGRNLVIEGPPGTGKSQTITNLIAAAMFQGKRVLFVAEKLAALEVVRSRLDAIGLGDFCLELHSHKSQKKRVLEEINKRFYRFREKPKDIDIEIAHYEKLKELLALHARKTNKPWKNTQKTPHEIFMLATYYRSIFVPSPDLFHPEGYDGSNYTIAIHRRNEDQIQQYCLAYRAIERQLGTDATLQEHPWYGVKNSDLQFFDTERVKETLTAWTQSLETLDLNIKEISVKMGCEQNQVAETSIELDEFLGELDKIPELYGNELLETLSVLDEKRVEEANDYLKLVDRTQALYDSLSKSIVCTILDDLNNFDYFLSAIRKLGHLFDAKVELAEVAQVVKKIKTITKEIETIAEPLQTMVSALDKSVAKHFEISLSGFKEFCNYIELIGSLEHNYWKSRNVLFDNEELDLILPKLEVDLQEMKRLKELASTIFQLEVISNEEEIRHLAKTVNNTSIFRWVNADWRMARKKLLGYAVNPKANLKKLIEKLDILVSFSHKKEVFENDLVYKKALGDFFDGIETDLDLLKVMRNWYKSIRSKYGVAFGYKVVLGDTLLDLSYDVFRGIRSLFEQKAHQRLHALIIELEGLKEVFQPTTKLYDKESILIGESNVLQYLLIELSNVVEAFELFTDLGTLSIGSLTNHVPQLVEFKKNSDILSNTKFDWILFDGDIPLQIWVNANDDNTKFLSMLRHTLRLATCLNQGPDNSTIVDYIYKHPYQQTFLTFKEYAQKLTNLRNSSQEFCEHFANFVNLDYGAWKIQYSQGFSSLIYRNKLALTHVEYLDNWLNYIHARQQLESLGLGKFADKAEHKELMITQLKDAYMAGIFDVLAREILREDIALSRFSGRSQEAIQQQFQECDQRLKILQQKQIAWKIDQTPVPYGNRSSRVADLTDRVLLEHECNKQTRHIPIRQLLKRAGDALIALKPCFMMGPMSVAQYLEPGQFEFDLIIMDEASQIKPQDALGAIARGRQLVVVGDPKQLPPTSFFDRVLENEEDDDITSIEESESILDASISQFSARRLRWHYRSQHESLIAFSNHFFYDGNLVVFPSPYKKTEQYGIQYVRVKQGCFINRQNKEESKLIAQYVREHFQTTPHETLGVVAMNVEQRRLIEMEIEILAKKDQIFQKMLQEDLNRHESLFVKNLENVQGDERDVVFISMTYGPPKLNDRVPQRFGPINSDVGWRRLNVLFTRSKKRMLVFSSMNSSDITNSIRSKRGVKALHDFLRFCETESIYEHKHENGDLGTDFGSAITIELKQAGFKCIQQVGVAGFFIDVAVVDPGNSGRYLMGIECDGATYYSAKSTRDRDHLRQLILNGLGWSMNRIWSIDWYKNPRQELEPIIRKLNTLKTPVIEHVVADDLPEVLLDVSTKDKERELVSVIGFGEGELKEKLMQFNNQVIKKEFPNTLDINRLLRSAMIEALVAYKPTNGSEFREKVPLYLRQTIDAEEAKYLDQIFDIINMSASA